MRAVDRGQWEARSRELLRTVGLAGNEDRHPRELSGVLDEPFAALDAFTREEMWELSRACS